MKFLNWGRVKMALNVFKRREGKTTAVVLSTAVAGITGNKHESFTLPDRVIKIKAWERRRNAKIRLPANTKVGAFVLFPFGNNCHVTHSGTVTEIRGRCAKIRMTCKSGIQDKGYCIVYRRISTPQ